MGLTGYDIDGVLTRPDADWQIDGAVVISGRTFGEYDETARRAAQICPVYIRGAGAFGDVVAAANFKASMIEYLGVTQFHEDDPTQIAIIRERCPGCEVVPVV